MRSIHLSYGRCVEQRIFDGLRKAIQVRKTIPAFADFNNRELIDSTNPHLFAFWRTAPLHASCAAVLVVANFDTSPQALDLNDLKKPGIFRSGGMADLAGGDVPERIDDRLIIPPHRFFWLIDQPSPGL